MDKFLAADNFRDDMDQLDRLELIADGSLDIEDDIDEDIDPDFVDNADAFCTFCGGKVGASGCACDD